jgi:hypothetical protein
VVPVALVTHHEEPQQFAYLGGRDGHGALFPETLHVAEGVDALVDGKVGFIGEGEDHALAGLPEKGVAKFDECI